MNTFNSNGGGHWLAQSAIAIKLLLSKSISTLDCSSIPSLLSSRNATINGGVPYYSMACFLSVRTIIATGEYTGQVNQ